MEERAVAAQKTSVQTEGQANVKGGLCMDELAMLDRETFAQVWSRVDTQGTGPVEPVSIPEPQEQPQPGLALQELVAECLAGAERYRALARRARRSGTELTALHGQKTAQAKRLSAAYFLRSGVRYWPRPNAPQGQEQSFFAALREQYLTEGRLCQRLEELARTAAEDLSELYAQLAAETAQLARQVQRAVEREL